MRIFARIVELGGFTRAAESLGITKSTVSRGMQVLEDRLGVKLVHRRTRNMSVTREGAMYYERCLRIFASIEEAEHHIAMRRRWRSIGGDYSAGARGCLSLGSLYFIAIRMALIMAAFLASTAKR
ncbi:LysR family transcriptional regulator [Cupriavidus sp. IDO]|uniref:LysR family transcriptional regulator n=1 Tax=Cupriavidus sp. IDO TaxID=1539142 RepID=UPI0005790880|nr:hypothetical protein RM96_07845 [Cupriavidus sp. IDO]